LLRVSAKRRQPRLRTERAARNYAINNRVETDVKGTSTPGLDQTQSVSTHT